MVTRIAPSPTGYMHLGTLMASLLNYLKARSNGGTFILRIDDSDEVRSEEAYVDYIYAEMERYKLDYDLTFRQSSRLDRYREVAELIGTKTERGLEVELTSDIGEKYNMVILRTSGYPTYNFSSTLDDFDYNVTNIIRGVDHIANETKQRQLWDMISKALNEEKTFPEVSYFGLIFEKQSKLSKRSQNGTTANYVEYDTEGVLNWMLRLGWSHPDSKFDKNYPIMTREQMIELFPQGKISQNNCKLNTDKLTFIDKKWKNYHRIALQK